MKVRPVLIGLCVLIVLLALVASGAGLFSRGGSGPSSFTTLHGQDVELYGRGVYRFDTSFKAPIFRGTDAILLFIGVPLLLVAAWLYGRGSLRGGLLLLGTLTCFLYNATSMALGAAYNNLFLLYVAYFSTSLYAFILAFTAIDLQSLPEHIAARMPHRGLAVFIFIAGLSPLVWLVPVVDALLKGLPAPDGLQSYTTDITTVLDVGIIVPTCLLTGVLLLRRQPLGYPLVSSLLTLLVLIGLIVAGQTVMQTLDGIVLTPGEFAAFVTPFVGLSLIAAGFLAAFHRNVVTKKR
jgi:hypothetical protein